MKPSVFAAAVAACLALAANAEAQTRLVVGHVSKSTTNWPFYIAEAKGMFKAENLEVENVVVGNVAGVAQQIVGGSLDLGNTTFEIVIQAVESGAPLSLIGATAIKYAYSLYGQKDIRSAADLKGRSVMVPVPKNDIANFFESWLKANNVKPSDVDVIYNGASTARYAAFTTGGVAAVAVSPPLDFSADAAGYNKLVDFGEFVKAYGFLGTAARKDWLAKNGPAARALMRALAKATDWLYDPANREEAIQLLMRETKVDHDIGEKTYNYVVVQLQAFSRGMKIPDADFMNVLKAFQDMGVAKNKDAKIEQYVDRSFLP
jgi:ABC-type nitrate/sulfonate/bicarbonate transport system substrate-binding protein